MSGGLSIPVAWATGIVPGFGARRAPVWLPSALFALSQPGIWLDGSDNSVMWQDAAGTTPVTALGQQVGLVLDKRLWQGKSYAQVMAEQAELVQPGWSQVGGSGILQSGQTFSLVSAPVSNYVEDAALIVGRTYRYEFTISGQSGLEVIRFQNASTSIVIPSAGAAGNGTYVGTFIATATQLRIRVYAETVDAAQVTLSCKEIPGNHAWQETSASRPIWQEDALGARGLQFDGSNDFLVTQNIDFSGSDKVMMAAGVRKLSDAAQTAPVGLSVNPSSNSGTFEVSAPGGGLGAQPFYLRSRGSSHSFTGPLSGFASPQSAVLTGLMHIGADHNTLRVNGVPFDNDVTDQGAGNYGNYPLYIGRRGGTSLPFNGFIHQLVVRGGALPDADELAQLEAFIAQKSKVAA